MRYNHPPAKKLRHRKAEKSVIETIVYHLSPEQIGRIGGEMAQKMVNAAQNYLEELAVEEVKKAFYSEIKHGIDRRTGLADQSSEPSQSAAANQSNDEVLSTQYPSDTGLH